MFYVGLDIHDQRIAICVLGETGQVPRRARRGGRRRVCHRLGACYCRISL
jgi:hypothetical protein